MLFISIGNALLTTTKLFLGKERHLNDCRNLWVTVTQAALSLPSTVVHHWLEWRPLLFYFISPPSLSCNMLLLVALFCSHHVPQWMLHNYQKKKWRNACTCLSPVQTLTELVYIMKGMVEIKAWSRLECCLCSFQNNCSSVWKYILYFECSEDTLSNVIYIFKNNINFS